MAPLWGTGSHPLYSLDRDDWVRVRNLQIGERLQTAEGAVSVEALEKVRGEHRVYNLEVEWAHKYLVGDALVRAHNTCWLYTQDVSVVWNLQIGQRLQTASGAVSVEALLALRRWRKFRVLA